MTQRAVLLGRLVPVVPRVSLCALLKGDLPGHEFRGNQWAPAAGAPASRPDGRKVVQHPPEKSSAERKGLKVGGKANYNYASVDTRFSGTGKIVGFVHNRVGGSAHGDVMLHDERRGSFVFVDSKNVYGLKPIKKAEDLNALAHAASTSVLNLRPQPTAAQRSAGNYKKGHVKFAGLDITIENPAGSYRKPEWPPMQAHYGYIKGTTGADDDHVDCFLKPSTPLDWRGRAYVIDQCFEDGEFDEHKIMLGWDEQRDAERAYLSHYPRGWALGKVTALSVRELRAWLNGGKTMEPFAKGDLPGHEFRGNQWTGGAGALSVAHTDKDGFVREGGLTKEEQAIEQRFYDRIKEDLPGLMATYTATIQKSGEENIIDPDRVKLLSPEFAANRNLAAAVHEPSSYVAKALYQAGLDKKAAAGDTTPTIFTAGGSGSGKSAAGEFALAAAGIAPGGLTVDSVLGNFDSASSRIDAALQKTKGDVVILYTNARLESAVQFNAGRDRSVSLATQAHAHVSASNNIRVLSKHYADNPRVQIHVINNLGAKADIRRGALSDIPVYNKNDAIAQMRREADSLKAKGVINDAKYQQLIRPPLGKSEGGLYGQARRYLVAGLSKGQRRGGLSASASMAQGTPATDQQTTVAASKPQFAVKLKSSKL